MNNSELKFDPVKFIFQQADEVTKLHLLQFLGLNETEEGKKLISHLLKLQMSSGGFPSEFNRKIESIKETCRAVSLLLKCGIKTDKMNIKVAINFLFKHQNEDGGWKENPSLIIPEEISWISTTNSITWLTADMITLLRSAGLDRSEQCIKAINWLRTMQNQEGGWSMFKGDQFRVDPDSTAQVLFLMREIDGTNSLTWKKGVILFEKYLDSLVLDIEQGYYTTPAGGRKELDIYHLTHLLLSSLADSSNRIEAGYDLNDERVKKIVQAIIDSQNENGGWNPFWTQKSDPVYTVLALKLLILLNVLNPEDLQKEVSSHC